MHRPTKKNNDQYPNMLSLTPFVKSTHKCLICLFKRAVLVLDAQSIDSQVIDAPFMHKLCKHALLYIETNRDKNVSMICKGLVS